MNKKAFISTPIYYASGNPHIGHAYTTLLADVLSRYKKMLGYDVFFVTGTDEFGQKIQTLAKANNLTEQEFVNKNCEKFIDLFNKLGIEYNGFSRTTNSSHIKTVQKIFSQMINNDDIYLDNWNGFYCVNCEENYTKSQVIEKDGQMFCNVGHKIIEKNEESYFFKMSKYNEWINSFLNENPNLIYPNHRVNELKNNFLKDLTDLSVSRTTTTWGIPILENPNHKIYVWVDALFNYLTILGYLQKNDLNYQNFWANKECEKIHIMSKEITRFHCIYWPIFLNSLSLNLPTKIYAHGWIVTKEGKMSKSLGNVIDPFELISNYSRDAVRYFFIKEINPIRDGIFSNDIFIETINTDLANNIGNLVNRTIGMLKKYTNGIIPKYEGVINSIDEKIEDE
ncbi:MAG: methionine--tRNA ligase, partial [Ureaplasma sp.]|nr:methionine--tRNA ligase [Ureaplasma sp.]